MADTFSLTSSFDSRKEQRRDSGLADTLTPGRYNLVLTGMLVYGFLVDAVMVAFLSEPLLGLMARMGLWGMVLLYIVPMILGMVIAFKSDNPMVSFLGYNLVVLPLGLLLVLVVPGLPAQIVTKAMLITAFVSMMLMLLGTVFPTFFLGLGRTLFWSVLIGVVAELICTFLFHYQGSAFDWLFVVLFSGYIGFDVARAQAYPKTLDNAIDSAVDIYTDIVILFVRILSLLSRRD